MIKQRRSSTITRWILLCCLAWTQFHCSAAKTISDRTPVARSGNKYSKLPSGTTVSTTATTNGVKATLDPNATTAQLISLDSGALSGFSVAFPVGSLSIPMTISISQGGTGSQGAILQNLGVTGNSVTSSGVPVEIAASAARDLVSPMVLAIPLPSGTGLVDSNVDRTRLAVMYRVKVAEGDKAGNFTGMVPATSLAIDNGKVLFETKYFGWFSVVVLANPAPPALEVKAVYAEQLAAMVFATPADLPACTSADTNRIAYVSVPSDGKYWVYCNGSSWTAVPKNPVEVTVPTDIQPIRLLRQSNSTEIGRVLDLGTSSSPYNIRLLVTSSAGNLFLVDINPASTSDILASEIAGLSLPTFTGDRNVNPTIQVGFTEANCTGTMYYNPGNRIQGVSSPIYIYNSTGIDGWYNYVSSSTTTTPTIVSSYNWNLSLGSRCQNTDPSLSSNSYQMVKLTETLPVPGAGAWKVQ